MVRVIYSIKEIVDILKARQNNKFDANFAVSGNRGLGKSTLVGKMYYRFDNFDPWKHQVYSRDDVLHLLRTEKFGSCWDDEAIYSSYKREFQSKEQQELIKNITVNRDNFNVLASTIPNFYSLDKDLRDLYFLHIHIVRRGFAVIHMPTQGRLYSLDKWDTKFNQKIEERWAKVTKKNIKFTIPYHKLSTFVGYLYFKDMTPKQRELYEEVKRTKKAKVFQIAKEQLGGREVSFENKVFNLLKERKLSNDGLLQACLVEGKKYSNVCKTLNGMIKDAGMTGTLGEWFSGNGKRGFHSNDKEQITNKIPSY